MSIIIRLFEFDKVFKTLDILVTMSLAIERILSSEVYGSHYLRTSLREFEEMLIFLDL